MDDLPDLDANFPRYRGFDPLVPVWCVTSHHDRAIHRFFDTSPFSPSGRFLGLTRLPYEDRLPSPGDRAEILLADLHTGELRVVAETAAWDTQLGAQVQWGADDSQLLFNEMDAQAWRPAAVCMDPLSGARQALDGPVYNVSPDGRRAASPCLLRIGRVQPGYGVIAPPDRIPVNRGAPADDGIFVTDTRTGRSTLLVSLAQIADSAGLATKSGGGLYCFHVKWSPTGARLQAVVCWVADDGGAGPAVRRQLVTMRADGSDIRVAIAADAWAKGGHHPNWCPDGEHVMMNLRLDGEQMRFVRARYDGTGLEAIVDGVRGSGHPTLHPGGHHILTDAYPREPSAFGDGTVPIRLVDVTRGEELAVARVRAVPRFGGPRRELRVDPHPAWDRRHRMIAFNGCPQGTRQVFVADLGGVLGAERPQVARV